MLEIGSATGRDAAVLEARGLKVRRTDATPAFVDRLRADGVAADVLNVITDELGGPWDAIYAGAVFLHLNVLELTNRRPRQGRSRHDSGRASGVHAERG